MDIEAYRQKPLRVHSFLAEQTANGYTLWFAVYVKKFNWFTPVYMAMISPLLKWIIYPAMLKGVRRRWEQSQMVKLRNRMV